MHVRVKMQQSILTQELRSELQKVTRSRRTP